MRPEPRTRNPSQQAVANAAASAGLLQQARHAYTGKKKSSTSKKVTKPTAPAENATRKISSVAHTGHSGRSPSKSPSPHHRRSFKAIPPSRLSQPATNRDQHTNHSPRPIGNQSRRPPRSPPVNGFVSHNTEDRHRPFVVAPLHHQQAQRDIPRVTTDNNDDDDDFDVDDRPSRSHLTRRRALFLDEDDDDDIPPPRTVTSTATRLVSATPSPQPSSKRRQIEDYGPEDGPNYADGGISEGGGGEGYAVDVEAGSGDDDEAIVVSRQPHTRHTKRRRTRAPKAGDYDPQTKFLLLHASAMVKIRIVTDKPFPAAEEQVNLVDHEWAASQASQPTYQADAETEWYSVVIRAIPQARGRLRDRIRSKVIEVFGIDERPSKALDNQSKIQQLLDHDSYLHSDTAARRGLWYNAILYKSIRSAFFSGSKDDGVIYSSHFNPIRPATIALVYTVVRLCLEEWKTGAFQPIEFKATTYEPIYNQLLTNLMAVNNKDPTFTQELGKELFGDCMASLAIVTDATPTTHSHEAMADAVSFAQERRAQRLAAGLAV